MSMAILGPRPSSSLNNDAQFQMHNPNHLTSKSSRGYKSRMCVFHVAGSCRNGSHCTYAHSPYELADPKSYLCSCRAHGCPHAHAEHELTFVPQKKTALCRYFPLGKCRAGGACRHAHSMAELLKGDPAWASGGPSAHSSQALPGMFFTPAQGHSANTPGGSPFVSGEQFGAGHYLEGVAPRSFSGSMQQIEEFYMMNQLVQGPLPGHTPPMALVDTPSVTSVAPQLRREGREAEEIVDRDIEMILSMLEDEEESKDKAKEEEKEKPQEKPQKEKKSGGSMTSPPSSGSSPSPTSAEELDLLLTLADAIINSPEEKGKK